MLKRILPSLLLVLSGTIFSEVAVAKAPAGPDTVYVDMNATGAADGNSWSSAYPSLEDAITNETDNAVFLVATGTYYPSASAIPSATFALKNGQHLYGGFPTGGSNFAARNTSTNKTTLSGDLNKNTISDNGADAYNIITLSYLTGTSVIDGFTITGANNAGVAGGAILIQNTDANISNNVIENNTADDGAGIHSICFTATPRIFKNTIRFNVSSNMGFGGGIYIDGPADIFTNVIYKNTSDNGGGIFVTETGYSSRVVGNTIACNYGGIKGILYRLASGGTVAFNNNVIWFNEFSFDSGGGIITDPQPADASYNICQSVILRNVNGNKNLDPLFTDTTSADFTLQRCSPAIEIADSTLLAAVTNDTTDFRGVSHFQDGDYNGTRRPDIGAFECDLVCEPCTTNAGSDAQLCGLVYKLGASKPGYQRTGQWTMFSGPGTAVFDDPSLPAATVVVNVQGIYVFRWTMTGNSCTKTDDVQVRFYSTPTANAGTDFQVCGKTAALAASLTTGTGIWSIVQGGSFTNNTLTNSSVTVPTYGTYQFNWTESNGPCPSSTDQVSVTFNNQSVANAGPDQTSCGLTTTLAGVASVGTGVWTKQSGPGTVTFADPTNPTTAATVSTYGTYVLKWTETNGNCSASNDLMTAFFKLQPVANAGVNIDTCNVVAQLHAFPSVGSGTWSKVSGPIGSTASFNQTTNPNTTVTVSTIGQYTLRWTEDNGSPCAVSTDDIIVDFAPPTIVNLEYIDDRYCGVNDEISLGIRMTGVSPYTFIIQSQHRTDTITTTNGYYLYTDKGTTKGQSEVSFTITKFTDGTGCAGIFSNNLITVPRRGTEMLPINDGFTVVNDTLCSSNTAILQFAYSNNENLTFQVEDSVHGRTFPVRYQSGTISVAVSDLAYGLNKFKITSITRDAGGCEMIFAGNREINVIYKPVDFKLTGQNITCFDAKDGSLAISDLIGEVDYTNLYINSVDNAVLRTSHYLFNVDAGNYLVRIVNAAGCEQTRSVTLIQPAKINYNAIIKNPTCYGYTNGSVEIQTSGGSGSLTTYFNGFTHVGSFKFISQKAGTYPVKIVDNNNGCLIFPSDVILTQPDTLTIATTVVDVNCDGTDNGNITIEPAGGTQPYTAQVTRGIYQENVPAFYPTANVGMLKQGTYNVRVIDSQGCISTVQATINEGVELTFKVEKIKDIDCASGGTINITQLSTIPGTKYAISNGPYGDQTSFTDLAAGTYVISGRTPAGCIRNYSVTILDNNIPFLASVNTVKQPTCFNGGDGKVEVVVSGGSKQYVLIMDAGAAGTNRIFDNLTPGTHVVKVIDVGCGKDTTITFSLNNPGSYSVTVENIVSPTCSYSHDGSFKVVPNGGSLGNFQYSSDNGLQYQFGNQFNNLGKGTYKVIAKDSKGCISLISETILTAPDSLKISATHVDNSTTKTSKVTIANGVGGTPPYYYSINGIEFTSQQVYENVAWAYVTCYIKDSNGCRNEVRFPLGNVGISTNAQEAGIVVYPNPSSGIIALEIPNGINVSEIVVMNSIGQTAAVISSSQLDNGKIDLTSLSKGLYQLLIKTDNSIYSLSVELSN